MKWIALALAGMGLALLPGGAARAADGESSFTPTRLIMPIYSVMLVRGLTTNVPLYTCTPGASGDASANDCLVDMADEAALANLFSQAVDIPAGSYDGIVVMSCAAGDNAFQAHVQGSVELEGSTYYTAAGVPAISTNPADLGYASINYAGCGNSIPLPRLLTVSAGDEITVSAFFTLENVSWVLTNSSPGLGGCAVAPGGSSNVCSGLPILVAYLGDVAPTLDWYSITEDPNDLLATKAAGQVMLLSSGGEPFSGFLRRVYSHDSPTPSVSYDVPLREITLNAEGASFDAGLSNAGLSDAGLSDAGGDAGASSSFPSYDIYAIGDPKEDLTKYRVRFPRFELRDHVSRLVTANGAGQRGYRAVKR
jgi:hypothetical protein